MASAVCCVFAKNACAYLGGLLTPSSQLTVKSLLAAVAMPASSRSQTSTPVLVPEFGTSPLRTSVRSRPP